MRSAALSRRVVLMYTPLLEISVLPDRPVELVPVSLGHFVHRAYTNRPGPVWPGPQPDAGSFRFIYIFVFFCLFMIPVISVSWVCFYHVYYS